MYFGLQRYIFYSGHLLVDIWEGYGETNRLLFADGDALKSRITGRAVLIVRPSFSCGVDGRLWVSLPSAWV